LIGDYFCDAVHNTAVSLIGAVMDAYPNAGLHRPTRRSAWLARAWPHISGGEPDTEGDVLIYARLVPAGRVLPTPTTTEAPREQGFCL
jgi:hypothetical protein